MLETFYIKGFPTLVSNEIDMPDIMEIIRMPFVHQAPIDDFYKNGTEFQRYLIDQLPILGKSNKIGVNFEVQYLYPGLLALPDRLGYPLEWHVDYNVQDKEEESSYRSHLLTNDCQAMTWFNAKEQELDMKRHNIRDTKDLILYLCQNEHILEPKQMSPNRIHTFDSHVHSVARVTKPQLRFIFRVMEIDIAPVRASYKDAIVTSVFVGRGMESVVTLKKTSSGVELIDTYWDETYYRNYNSPQKNQF